MVLQLSLSLRRWQATRVTFSRFHGGIISQEKNKIVVTPELYEDVSARALEELSNESYGGYIWNDISKKFQISSSAIQKEIETLTERRKFEDKAIYKAISFAYCVERSTNKASKTRSSKAGNSKQ